jgi:hypothetical protein
MTRALAYPFRFSKDMPEHYVGIRRRKADQLAMAGKNSASALGRIPA